MSEAYAQTAEIIGAVQKGAEWYTGQAGIVAGTWLIVAAAMGFIIWKLLKQLDDRATEITALKVTCAKEIADVKLASAAEVKEQSDIAWKRVDQIYQSVQALFAKCDASNEKVSTNLGRLTNMLATKGVFSND